MDDVMEGVREALRRVGAVAQDGGERLSLAGLGLSSVPPEVRALRSLPELDLSGNRLEEIPEWIGELEGLRLLDVSGNLLTRLPSTLGRLRSLTGLVLSGNRLTALPAELAGLGALRRLELGENRFVDVPVWVGGLPLEHLGLAGNPHLLAPPPQVVEAGSLAVLEYLRAATSAESPPPRSRPVPRERSARALSRPTMPLILRPSRRAAAIGGAAILLGVAALAIAANGGGSGTPVHATGAAAGTHGIVTPTPSSTGNAFGVLGNTAAVTPSKSSPPTPKKPAATTPGTTVGAHNPIAIVKPPVPPLPPQLPHIAPPPVPASTNLPAPPPPPPPAPPQPPQPISGQIIGYGGLCLDDQGASTADYNPVDIFTCNGTGAQNWTVVTSDDTIQVFGKCLDVYAAQQSNGTPVDLYHCNGTGAQVWIPRADGSLFNPNSGKCLDDTDWSTTPGKQVQIWDCNSGQANQTWQMP
jgi:hypothetical protein